MSAAELPRASARAVAYNRWTLEDTELLRRLIGTAPLPDVARAISEATGVPRTRNAVAVKCFKLGISTWTRFLTMSDLERLFGVWQRTIRHYWVEPGLLSARRWDGRGADPNWWFEPADVERFIRGCPWAYDWRQMARGERLSHLAEVVNRRDPWLTVRETAPMVGVAPSTIKKWIQRGVVPHRRRGGVSGDGEIMLRAREFREIRRLIEEAGEAARREGYARGLATRRGRVKA